MKKYIEELTEVDISKEEISLKKIAHTLDFVSSMNDMAKSDFLENIFDGALKLIPEAEKGSF